MTELFLPAGLVVLSATLNVTGATLLKLAAETGSGAAAIGGCLAWAATSAIFLALLRMDHPLALLSTVTSAVGFLAVMAVGMFFGEVLTGRQMVAVGLMMIGMVLLGLPART